MTIIQIELPDEVLLSLKETPEGLSKMIRMAAEDEAAFEAPLQARNAGE